jgi:hypothetical protein
VTPAELRLVERLLAIARDRQTESGHRAIVSTEEGQGHCRYTKSGGETVKHGHGFRVLGQQRTYRCGEKCLELAAVIRDAEALMAEHANAEPRQMEFVERAS